MHRFIVTSTVLIGLCLFAFSQNNQTSPFDVSYAQSTIQWSVFIPSTGTVLTVSGPDGYYLRQEYSPGSRPQFGVTDEQGVPRPEGPYRWELVAQLPPGAGGEVLDEPNPVAVSGSFVISGGVIVPQPDDTQPAVVEEGAPPRSLFLDREGRLGLGTTVPQSQLHLKGSNPALTLEDTTTGGRVFTLRGLEKGDGSLGLFGQTAGQARWLVDREGRMGINTTKPTSTLTVDGYIEATKGFLVNGRPLPVIGGWGGGVQPAGSEGIAITYYGQYAGSNDTGVNNAFFGFYAGHENTTGGSNSIFGSSAGVQNTTGSYNSFFGQGAGWANTSSGNSFFGNQAGLNNASGDMNSFFGNLAGNSNVSGAANSFFGSYAGERTVSGSSNSFFGVSAGYWNSTGGNNSFFGRNAGANSTTNSNSFFGSHAGYSNATGNDNSFFGRNAGYSNTTSSNSFFGSHAGYSNTAGSSNAFFGTSAGYSNVSGNANSFFGYTSGWSNTGSYNSFFGANAGFYNTSGNYNSFFGDLAGWSNEEGSGNSFFGYRAGFQSQTSESTWPRRSAEDNSFFGREAGYSNLLGDDNSFFGAAAGYSNVSSSNSFFGKEAGYWNTSGGYNTAFGRYAGNHNTTGGYNTFVGYTADTSSPGGLNNATAIGANAYVAQSNSLVLGSIPDVNGGTSYVNVGIGTSVPARQLHLAGPNAVFRLDRTTDTASFILVRTDPTGATPWKTFVVGTNATGVNQGEFIINDVGTAVGGAGNRRMTITNAGNVQFTGVVSALGFAYTSSRVLKTNIHTFKNALDTVNRLRGVRFDWKDSGEPAVGLIAEEVDEVLPEVVARQGGKARGVNYANLVAVLVEAVKEQQKAHEKDRRTIAEQQKMMIQQQAEIDSLRSLKAKVEKLEALLGAR